MLNRAASVLALLTLSSIRPLFAQAPCVAPPAPAITSGAGATVGVGQTYALAWTNAAGDDGWYVVERSISPAFDAPVETQFTSARAASFASASEARYYQRIRAVAACDPAKVSEWSAPAIVDVVPGVTSVVVTRHPEAVFADASQGAASERTFVIFENLGRFSVEVAVLREYLNSPPFFRVTDADGNDVTSLALAPREPRRLEIRFNAPPGVASYQGVISLRGLNAQLPAAPHAYVSLRVGDSSGGAAPEVRINGVAEQVAFFPPHPAAEPDVNRPPLRVELYNPGTLPLEVAAEIGPELWVMPAAGWNVSAIPPGGSIFFDLKTDRARVSGTAAFPRYTYLYFRSRGGGTARLLVQDPDAMTRSTGPLPPPAPDRRLFLVPLAVRLRSSLNVFTTTLRLTNVSHFALPVSLFFIGQGEANVDRATVVVPPNDVVVLSDVVGAVGAPDGTTGHLEIRTSEHAAELLTITAATHGRLSGGRAGETVFNLPVMQRGEGARAGSPHWLAGAADSVTYRSTLVLLETSRNDGASVKLTLHSELGAKLHEVTIPIAAGAMFYAGLFRIFGEDPPYERARLTIETDSGAIAGGLYLIDEATRHVVASYVSGPLQQAAPLALTQAEAAGSANTPLLKTYLLPGAVNGRGGVAGANYATALGVTALDRAADLLVSVVGANTTIQLGSSIRVPAGHSVELSNVFQELFGISPATQFNGTIAVKSADPVYVTGTVSLTRPGQPTAILGALPVVPSTSEAISGVPRGLQRPVYFDGVEQSTEPTRGTRWSLSLTELSGAPATVTVRLYEPANRSAPLAERDVTVARFQHVVLDTIFGALGLESEDRRKDRTNVQVVVTPRSGNGSIVAVAIGTDAVTGGTVRFLLTPNGGVAATGITKVVHGKTTAPRRRSARP